MVTMRVSHAAALAVVLGSLFATLMSVSSGQGGDEGTALSPEAHTLYPASVDLDGDRTADAYVLQTSADTGDLVVILGSEATPISYVLTPPLANGIMLDTGGEIVVTWSLQATAGAMATVNAELTAGNASLGSGTASGQAVAGQPTTFEIRFAPARDVVMGGEAVTLTVSTDTTPPQPGTIDNLPNCKLELPILSVLGAPSNTTANNTTDGKQGDDTPALGFALIGAGVAMAAWVTGRRRR